MSAKRQTKADLIKALAKAERKIKKQEKELQRLYNILKLDEPYVHTVQ